MSIQVENISKLYGSQKALNNVSFEVNTGEVVGFLGPNGAGKSTMMKIITCYLPQTAGKVNVCGFDVEEQPMEVKKRIGYLPEHNPLYLDMYVKEYLELISGIHNLNNIQRRINEVIGLTGLGLEKHKKIGALSKGYRQRVGLAQALIADPQVLILDEPTSGLDPNQLAEVRNLIKDAGKQKTVMLSTHIMQEVEAICDRVIIINKGEIVADKPTSELRKGLNDQLAVTVEFNKAIPAELRIELEKIAKFSVSNHLTVKLISLKGNDIRPEINKLAVQFDMAILTMKLEEQKLEDVFKQLTAL